MNIETDAHTAQVLAELAALAKAPTTPEQLARLILAAFVQEIEQTTTNEVLRRLEQLGFIGTTPQEQSHRSHQPQSPATEDHRTDSAPAEKGGPAEA